MFETKEEEEIDSIALTYFFLRISLFPVLPWHLPFFVVLFVSARNVRAWRVLKQRPRAKVKMHRHANPVESLYPEH